MLHPLVHERIKRDLPDMKLLVLLRDPVERAFSSCAYSVAAGCERESFERGHRTRGEPAGRRGREDRADPAYDSLSHRHHAYRPRGHDIDQLERLERLFGRERIHVVERSDFRADPAPVYHRVLEFLGLPRAGDPDFLSISTPGRGPRPCLTRSARHSKSITARTTSG